MMCRIGDGVHEGAFRSLAFFSERAFEGLQSDVWIGFICV